MKKFLKSLVAVMLVCLMAVSFTSCGIPNDPAKAEENLKAEEYVISTEVATGIIKTYVGLKWGADAFGKIDKVVWATKDAETILIIYVEDKELRGKLYEDLEAIYDKVAEDDDADVKKGKSGSCMWIGTAAGVKAAK